MNDWTKAVGASESIAKILAIPAAGSWAFWRYVYQGDFKRKIGFTVDVNFVCAVKDLWLIELVALLDNKGLVTHTITDFSFQFRCIYESDPVVEAGARANWQTDIPHRLKKGSWRPQNWGNTFVRPGICIRYT